MTVPSGCTNWGAYTSAHDSTCSAARSRTGYQPAAIQNLDRRH